MLFEPRFNLFVGGPIEILFYDVPVLRGEYGERGSKPVFMVQAMVVNVESGLRTSVYLIVDCCNDVLRKSYVLNDSSPCILFSFFLRSSSS